MNIYLKLPHSHFKRLINLLFYFCSTLYVTGTQQPNVVLIICDDLNDYITGIPGQTGHSQASSPNVEKLAQSGVSFRRAYSNNPVCATSRASFLTGLYSHTAKNLFWGTGLRTRSKKTAVRSWSTFEPTVTILQVQAR